MDVLEFRAMVNHWRSSGVVILTCFSSFFIVSFSIIMRAQIAVHFYSDSSERVLLISMVLVFYRFDLSLNSLHRFRMRQGLAWAWKIAARRYGNGRETYVSTKRIVLYRRSQWNSMKNDSFIEAKSTNDQVEWLLSLSLTITVARMVV